MLFSRLSRPLVLLIAFGFATSADAIQVESLHCEHLLSPHCVDVLQPRLSWTLGSDERGDRQTAYQVLVATTPEQLAEGKADAWDSGKRESIESVLVPYAGRELHSHERLYWTVRVWDRQGKPSAWSEPADWIMGVLDGNEWEAKWIGKAVPERVENLSDAQWIWFPDNTTDRATKKSQCYLRRAFTLPAGKAIEHAVLRMAAVDHVDIYLNGRKLGSRSGHSSAKELDLTHLLREGKNVIAATPAKRSTSNVPAAMVAWLKVDFVDAEPLVVMSDASWLASDEETADWIEPDFVDSDWVAADELAEVGADPWGPVRHAESRRLPARYLRKQFTLDKPVRRATVSLCGLGCSELFANGKRVGDQVLSPAMSQYPERSYYITRDVTDSLRVGDNVLGCTLGNGRFYAMRSEVYAGMPTYGSPMLLLRLTIEHEDGSVSVVTSDTAWRMTDDGPIVANNEYDGEEYDARRELDGWTDAGYDDASWEQVEQLDRPSKRIEAEPIAPMRVTQTLAAKTVTEPSPGVYIYDLGQNMVGWCRLKVSGPAGATVRLRHAERLTDDGELYLENLRGAKATDRYTLRGGGEEVWEPQFTLHGFRYVEVTGYPGEPTLDAIEGRVVHDDMEPVGEFACSNEVVNQVYRNAVWGFRGNYRTTPLDCPQRDERQGWLGDRLETARSESYVYNVAAFYEKWLTDIRDSQRENGSLPDIAPIHWPRFSDNVVWPSTAILLPEILNDQYGDRRPIEKQYESNARWIDHMAGYLRDDGLIDRDSYGDWCVPPESPELIHSLDPERITDTTLLASMFFYYDLKRMEQYASMLGHSADQSRFAEMADRLREAINTTYYNADAAQYSNGTQSSSVMPLAFGLPPQGQREMLAATLARHVAERDGGAIATGLVGGQFLCRTLTDIGRPDLAFAIASREAYPSWGYMASQGATTIWELWNGDTADPAMNSGNHVMLIGDLVTWLYEDLAGIAPAQPGFRRIEMRPQMVEGLDGARASYRSPYGQIKSEWRRDNGAIAWRIVVPPGTTADVHLPTADASAVTEGGAPLGKADGIGAARILGGRVGVEVASGAYEFRITGQ
ncbi:Bacterial alpha-L-rhamnosidase [Botrimarina colliarenosi]|uniref:alpha-L-rhamnosidase n=1 Tax=Botrimarina colliarenosi TaxID=2528001 RepID=A0A5C6AE66_9BACT|nr:family 78 glycoside hydrolase catalytic domain [Botrimarina colliarenosi]TWT97710.1 Bacterial alpha-L-rhamnosidase [Botrimarina colliarenosi]